MPLSCCVLRLRQTQRVAKADWKFHKFGGTSLADAACFRRVAGLLLQQPEKQVGVVVSAMGGMTDALLELAVLAERDDDAWQEALHRIGERYAAAAGELLHGRSKVDVLDAWGRDAG